MATLSPMFAPMRVSSLANDDTPTSSQDPFWQATPRTVTSQGAGAVKAAVQQKVPQPASTKQVRPAAPATARRPACTHMTMNRMYGKHTCYMCAKVPSMGWVYICTQDHDFNQLSPPDDPDSFPVVPNESGYYDVQARLAESLGIAARVVKGIRDREYTFEQVDKLIEQKKHLLATIAKQDNPSSECLQPQNARPRTQSTKSVIASVSTTAAPAVQASVGPSPLTANSTPSTMQSADGTVTTARKLRGKKQTCNFQVCHACRPFFKDRLYMSFEKALNGRQPAVTEEDIKQLPMLDPAVVRKLGVRQPHIPPIPTPQIPGSFDGNADESDTYEEDTSDWTPASATISESDSDRQDEGDLYPCPGVGVCPLWSRYSGCAYDSGFDDGLRALNHGFGPEPDLSRMTPENSLARLRRVRGSVSDTPGGSTSTASSISLPTPGFVPLTPVTPVDRSFEDALTMRLSKPGKAASICGPFLTNKRRGGRYGLGVRGKDSNSSLGSEVEVEGGVALTEEGVETGTPDIRTDDEEA